MLLLCTGDPYYVLYTALLFSYMSWRRAVGVMEILWWREPKFKLFKGSTEMVQYKGTKEIWTHELLFIRQALTNWATAPANEVTFSSCDGESPSLNYLKVPPRWYSINAPMRFKLMSSCLSDRPFNQLSHDASQWRVKSYVTIAHPPPPTSMHPWIPTL